MRQNIGRNVKVISLLVASIPCWGSCSATDLHFTICDHRWTCCLLLFGRTRIIVNFLRVSSRSRMFLSAGLRFWVFCWFKNAADISTWTKRLFCALTSSFGTFSKTCLLPAAGLVQFSYALRDLQHLIFLCAVQCKSCFANLL